ncbi:MAG: pyridoxamine 5'-phosphate oxidase family protein [Desulfobulbaceae bacterium]|nr:pyridoxamine 5'-phosphate oxidase family protein [Desulfobulbaceae bacterium]
MMRELRRKDKQISMEEAQALLEVSEYGVLSTVDSDGQSYGVPLNYVYTDGAIFFHCALPGHKVDNIENNPKVSFCVVGDTKVLPSDFSTNYASTIVFGTASEVEGQERYDGLMKLLEKYSPDYLEEGKKYIEKLDNVTKVIKIDIKQMSGKKAPAKV